MGKQGVMNHAPTGWCRCRFRVKIFIVMLQRENFIITSQWGMRAGLFLCYGGTSTEVAGSGEDEATAGTNILGG
jgi:hypothetical protein